jgi:WD40 repeat protein
VKRELGKLERFVQAVAASTRVGFKSPRAQV